MSKPDGTVHIYTHNQNPQELRGEIAMMLRTTPDHVIVHAYPGPGHYGRSNGGNAGAEDEAVLLSQAVGKPVRVQWMRADDMQWSTQSAAAFSDIQIALDEKGKIAAYQSDHFMPAMQDDRPIGAVLAGLPTMPAPDVHSDVHQLRRSTALPIRGFTLRFRMWWSRATAHSRWDRKRRLSPSVSATTACGRRCSSSRTFRANWRSAKQRRSQAPMPCSSASTTPAKSASIGVLKAVRDASGWDTRPSPRPDAVATGSTPVRGRGVSLMFRSLTYWACVCQIAVTPSTGVIVVEKYTIAVDPGIVVNPAAIEATGRRRRGHGNQPCPARRGDV